MQMMQIIRCIGAGICVLGITVPGCGGGESYFKSRFGLTLDRIYWGEFHDHTIYSGDAKYCIVNDEPARLPAGAYAYARAVVRDGGGETRKAWTSPVYLGVSD